MRVQDVYEHINRKYVIGEDKATFLVKALYQRRKLIGWETADSIAQILNSPVCTGVLYGQMARNYQEIMSRQIRRKESPFIRIRKICPTITDFI